MNEVNLRRRDDDKVLFTRSTLPPALGYAPYLLALSPLTLPDLDHLSADSYQDDKGRYHWSLTSVIGIPPKLHRYLPGEKKNSNILVQHTLEIARMYANKKISLWLDIVE